MKHSKLNFIYLAFALCMMLALVACQQESPKKQQVKAFLQQAVAYIHKNGEIAALKEFNKKNGLFNKGALYVYAYNYQGICLANGGNPLLAGRNLSKLRDIKGKLIIQVTTQKARSGGGWVHYYWTDPVTNTVLKKIAYILPINDHLYIGAGYYIKP